MKVYELHHSTQNGRDDQAQELAEEWINGNRTNVAGMCLRDAGLLAAVAHVLFHPEHSGEVEDFLSFCSRRGISKN